MDFIATVLAFIGVLLGALASGLVARLQSRRDRATEPGPPTLEQRLGDLASLMAASGRLLEEVQAEIEARVALANRAKQDADEAEQLARLTEPQRQALARLVRAEVAGEVTKNSRKSFWQSALVNFTFFVAGAGISLLTTLWF